VGSLEPAISVGPAVKSEGCVTVVLGAAAIVPSSVIEPALNALPPSLAEPIVTVVADVDAVFESSTPDTGAVTIAVPTGLASVGDELVSVADCEEIVPLESGADRSPD
jgi:hypothetical protein